MEKGDELAKNQKFPLGHIEIAISLYPRMEICRFKVWRTGVDAIG